MSEHNQDVVVEADQIAKDVNDIQGALERLVATLTTPGVANTRSPLLAQEYLRIARLNFRKAMGDVVAGIESVNMIYHLLEPEQPQENTEA